MARRVKARVIPPKRKRAPRNPEPEEPYAAGEAHEFIRSVTDLRHAIENLTDSVEDLRETVKTHDEHNASLYHQVKRLADRIDIINGVGSLVGKLLPNRQSR